MNGHTHFPASAKVLAFPRGGRLGFAKEDIFTQSMIGNDNRPSRQIVVDAWYHEAAMAEESAKKNS